MIKQPKRLGIDDSVLSYALFALALIVGSQAVGLHWMPLARSVTACVLASISFGVALASWKTHSKTNYSWTYMLWILFVILQDLVAAGQSSGLTSPDWKPVFDFGPLEFLYVAGAIIAVFVDMVNLAEGLRNRGASINAGSDEYGK